MSVQCQRCGQEWPRDPALEVACPTCRAPIGAWCKRPSGHQAQDLHTARDRLALDTIPDYGRCPAADAPPTDLPMQRQLALFE